ncbi:unnamed protein product [Clonostachys byssicola]|uniref:Aspartate/glutamate racemase family protein n=1 Tax=Clonostachys byssicola TaxID=160290 RepID=A0A9N9UU46_9HYPO|nr:unnamed protein product [Clonostachys byssicola]
MTQPDNQNERPPLGFLATEINFHRPPGDGFNNRTWSFPLIQQVAKGSLLVQLVSKDEYPEEFIENFVKASEILIAKGCVGIITSCGFLAMAQPELSKRLSVPIATSSLLQIPGIQGFLPKGKVPGVITFDGTRLKLKHFQQLGIANAESIPIEGCPDPGELRRVIRDGLPYVHDKLEAELVQAAKNLVRRRPDVGAIVLECTQLPPFAKAIQAAVKVPVFDVYTLGEWFYSGLSRKGFAEWTATEKIEARQHRPRSKVELSESKL